MKIVRIFLVLLLLVILVEVESIKRHRGKPAEGVLQSHHRANRVTASSTKAAQPGGTGSAEINPEVSSSPSVTSSSSSSTTTTTESSTTSTTSSSGGGAWKSFLKPKPENLTPEQKKAEAELCAKRGSLANMVKQNLTAGYKDMALTKKSFSVGFSGYVFVNYLNVFFKDLFVKDAQAIKAAFFTDPKLTVEILRDKLPDFHWDMNDDPLDTAKLVVKQYDIAEKGSLNFKEFSWYAIKETSSYSKDFKCQNCFESIRPELQEFFDFVDCNSNGYVSSEEIYRSLNKLESKKAADSRETNDFVLKADPKRKGFLKKTDFVMAALKGLWEQYVNDDGVS